MTVASVVDLSHTPMHKTCKKCGDSKLREDFYSRGASCKSCCREQSRANAKANYQRYKDYWKTPAHKAAKASYMRTTKGRFKMLRENAKKGEHALELTFEQFADILAFPCAYCGHPLPETGSCIDRRDSAGDYTVTNSVACCHECNVAKSNKWTYEEFLEVGAAIGRVKSGRTS